MSIRSTRFWWHAAFVVLLAAGIRPAASQTVDPTATPEPSEPSPAPIIVAPAGELPSTAYQPFVSTAAMTDTVAAVAAALNQLPQPLTPPDGAVYEQLPELSAQQHSAALRHRRFVPFANKPRRAPNEPTPPPAADIAVVVWPQPSIRVIRGGTLRYTVRITNHGQGDAPEVRVRLPYPQQQLAWQYAIFSPGSGDYVTSVDGNAVEVRFAKLGHGASRSATLTYRASSFLANDAVINLRASYTWHDEADGGRGSANWTPVLVGAGDADSPYLWMSRSPAAGRPGSSFQFFSDRFLPGEGVVTWLNTPAGVRPTQLNAVADGDGRVWLDFNSSGLAPGNYSLVAYGSRSALTAVAGFTVTP